MQLIIAGIGNKENHLALNASIERLNRLFDDIVLMNRPSENIEPTLVEAYKLNQILEDLKTEFNDVILENRITQNISAEEMRLRIILRNLVKNAIRYGKRAHLSFQEEKNFFLILVKDEGPGISQNISANIFEEFYRSNEAKQNHADGLGLGLFIVKRMALEMSAQIRLTIPGEMGACFELKIPRSKS